MMCEACDKAAHCRCMGLRETPVGGWLCPSCCPKPACNLPWRHGGKSNVLSLFDGIAIGRQALKELGFKELGGYHAFEVDSKAIRVATSNHSDITQHGDVCQVWVPTLHLAICTVIHIVLNSYCNLCCINLYCVQTRMGWVNLAPTHHLFFLTINRTMHLLYVIINLIY